MANAESKSLAVASLLNETGMARRPDIARIFQQAQVDAYAKPTRREIQVLDCLERGMANKQIANELGISEGTTKIYFARIFQKFMLTSRLEAALWWKAKKASVLTKGERTMLMMLDGATITIKVSGLDDPITLTLKATEAKRK